MQVSQFVEADAAALARIVHSRLLPGPPQQPSQPPASDASDHAAWAALQDMPADVAAAVGAAASTALAQLPIVPADLRHHFAATALTTSKGAVGMQATAHQIVSGRGALAELSQIVWLEVHLQSNSADIAADAGGAFALLPAVTSLTLYGRAKNSKYVTRLCGDAVLALLRAAGPLPSLARLRIGSMITSDIALLHILRAVRQLPALAAFALTPPEELEMTKRAGGEQSHNYLDVFCDEVARLTQLTALNLHWRTTWPRFHKSSLRYHEAVANVTSLQDLTIDDAYGSEEAKKRCWQIWHGAAAGDLDEALFATLPLAGLTSVRCAA